MAATDLEPAHSTGVVTHVDTAEVPSAAWGWSGESRRSFRTAGWVVVAILLLMMIGNHEGHIEDLYLIGLAALIAFALVRDTLLQRKPR